MGAPRKAVNSKLDHPAHVTVRNFYQCTHSTYRKSGANGEYKANLNERNHIMSTRQPALLILILAYLMVTVAAVGVGDESTWTVTACDLLNIGIVRDDVPLFYLQTQVVGPGWMKSRLGNQPVVSADSRTYEQIVGFYEHWTHTNHTGELMNFKYELTQAGDRAVKMRFTCRVDNIDTYYRGPSGDAAEQYIGIGPVFEPGLFFGDKDAVLELADGSTHPLRIPLPRRWGKENIARVTLNTVEGTQIELTCNPPIMVHADNGQARFYACRNVPAGETLVQEYTFEFPRPIVFQPANRYLDQSDWFALDMEGIQDFKSPSVAGMRDWLEERAGSHGYIQVKGKDFICEDGTPIKFWGVNQCCRNVCPEAEDAEQWADKWAKYGVNLVRMHKFVGHGWVNSGIHNNHDTRKIDPEMGRHWDAYNAMLAERGIYTGWSPFYALKLTKADENRVWAYDEIMRTDDGPGWYHASTIGLVNFAPDLQDLHIAIFQNLLNRTNTVTGKRYADDPSLAYIEIQNEDDIFFWYDDLVNSCPTYKNYLNREFSKWLIKKYGAHTALAKAWKRDGPSLLGNENPVVKVVDVEENLNELDADGIDDLVLEVKTKEVGGTVAAMTDPYFFGGDGARRIQDSFAFLYECQDKYYKRVVKAIRATGYRGAICGSCWQTKTFLSHLYNLRSDREVGYIDRHNYGGTDLLRNPGAGLLSSGMQQVSDRPFGLSEWAGGGVFRGMESVPVIGFIGMGVQGWDLSAHFASNGPRIDNYNYGVCDDFKSVAQYWTVGRAVYRGDFKEVDPVAVRSISIPGMAHNKLGFSEYFSLQSLSNVKEFSSVIAREALCVGPVMLEFVDGPVKQPLVRKFEQFVDEQAKIIRAASGQARLDFSRRGLLELDTPGTQGLIGFTGGKTREFANLRLTTDNLFSIIYVTALDPNEKIADAKHLLITTLGRMMAKGTVFDEISMKEVIKPEDPGAVDFMLEPLRVNVELKHSKPCKVFALDHLGRKLPDAKPLSESKNTFTLDGSQTRTCFYLVEAARP